MHKVKCMYCGEIFDRDKEEFKQVKERRYAHLNCALKYDEEKPQEEKDYEELEEYIKKLFGKDYVTAKVKKQIKDYKKEYKYTFSGIHKTLIWWFELKKNSIDKTQGGIGIVPFVYDQACQYYYSLYLAQLANENKDNIGHNNIIEIEVPTPYIYVQPPHLFDLDRDWEE